MGNQYSIQSSSKGKISIIIGIVIVIILIVIAVIGYWKIKYPATVTPEEKNVQKQNNVSIKEEKITENTNSYSIDLVYPQLSGLENSAVEKSVNDDIKNSITKRITWIKEIAAEETELKYPYELGNSEEPFKINYVTDKLLSVRLSYYFYTGGAHGLTNFIELNYNLINGKKISVKDFFKKDSPYLERISDYSINTLNKELLKTEYSGEEWIKEGAGPKPDNYSDNVGFSEKGLEIVFQEYQVAPFVAGPQFLIIPYKEIEDIIDPNGPLSIFLEK